MKTNFTRRKFLQTAAVSATAAMLPSVTDASALPVGEKAGGIMDNAKKETGKNQQDGFVPRFWCRFALLQLGGR